MTRALTWLRDAVLGNFAYKVAALFFALVTWGWVQSEQIVETDVAARVEWRFPEGLVPVEAPPDAATLRLKGVQAYVRSVQASDLAIVVDLTGAREGQVGVNLAERPVEGLPPQVRTSTVAPSQTSIVLDRLQKRRIAVVPTTRGELPPGLRLAKLAVSPESVELNGPASVLRALSEVATDAVDLSALTDDAILEVGLGPSLGQLTPTSPARFSVKIDLSQEISSRTLSDVAIGIPAGWSSSVPRIEVRLTGPTRAVDALGEDSLHARVEVPDSVAPEARALEARAGTEVGARIVLDVPPGVTFTSTPEVVPLERQ